MDLTEFLLARIDEDEAGAKAADDGSAWLVAREPHAGMDLIYPDNEEYYDHDGVTRHISHWSPTCVLAECDAKRRIVELTPDLLGDSYESGFGFAHDTVLQLLALPYADHKDYRSEWAAVTSS